MLDLLPPRPHQCKAPTCSWEPTNMYDPPQPPTAEERLAEQQRLEQQAQQAAEAGGRVQRNRNRTRRTVDYFAGLERWRLLKTMRTSLEECYAMRPNPNYVIDLLPPSCYPDNYSTSICGKYIHTSMNKVKCPINVVRWTPEGRRVLTGAASGEFTLWNGLAFNFETILQAHDSAVRCAEWSTSGTWLVSGDQGGVIKYFQNNMNNLQAFQGHSEPIRDVSFSPNDARYVTASDDFTIKIWDFEAMREERTLTGHGWDVKCVKWHPTKGLLVSGSKDNLVKFWDPKSAKCLTTLHGHKNTVQAMQWSPNGNLVATGSRDSFVKVYDIRAMKELITLRGHKKEVSSLTWHPVHHNLLTSGGSDGSIMHWAIDQAQQPLVDNVEFAHDGTVWSLAYHPLGHVLASCSQDNTTRFWSRYRPGQSQNNIDRYHVGREKSKEMGVKEDDDGDDEFAPLPGLGNAPFSGGYVGHASGGHPSSYASHGPPGLGDGVPGIPGFGSGGPPPGLMGGHGNYRQPPPFPQQNHGFDDDHRGMDRRRRRRGR